MMRACDEHRRAFLKSAGIVSGGLVLAGAGGLNLAAQAAQVKPEKPAAKKEGAAGDVSPAEDLMREHGALGRILLIYDEAVRRIEAHAELPPGVLVKATDLVRRFVQDYHEKLEENYLFPRFVKAKKLVDLVAVLLTQHQAGRRVADEIKARATAAALKSRDESRKLVESLRAFARMYRPHKAREDTILFPALHTIVTESEYDKLGDEFEDKEHELFGAEGFEKVVEQVGELEKTIGLYELAQFTL